VSDHGKDPCLRPMRHRWPRKLTEGHITIAIIGRESIGILTSWTHPKKGEKPKDRGKSSRERGLSRRNGSESRRRMQKLLARRSGFSHSARGKPKKKAKKFRGRKEIDMMENCRSKKVVWEEAGRDPAIESILKGFRPGKARKKKEHQEKGWEFALTRSSREKQDRTV